MAWVCGLWFVPRASRTSRAACLLKINKQVYLSSNLKSLFTGHRKPETVTAVFLFQVSTRCGKCAKNRRNLMRPYLSVINFRMKMLWFDLISTGVALRVEGDQASFCHQGTEKRCRVRRWWCGVYNGGTKSPGFSHETSLPHSPSFCLPVPGIRERAIVAVSTSSRTIRLRLESIRLRPICVTRESFRFSDEVVFEN